MGQHMSVNLLLERQAERHQVHHGHTDIPPYKQHRVYHNMEVAIEPGMVKHTYNISTQDAMAGELRVQSQHRLYSENLS